MCEESFQAFKSCVGKVVSPLAEHAGRGARADVPVTDEEEVGRLGRVGGERGRAGARCRAAGQRGRDGAIPSRPREQPGSSRFDHHLRLVFTRRYPPDEGGHPPSARPSFPSAPRRLSSRQPDFLANRLQIVARLLGSVHWWRAGMGERNWKGWARGDANLTQSTYKGPTTHHRAPSLTSQNRVHSCSPTLQLARTRWSAQAVRGQDEISTWRRRRTAREGLAAGLRVSVHSVLSQIVTDATSPIHVPFHVLHARTAAKRTRPVPIATLTGLPTPASDPTIIRYPAFRLSHSFVRPR